MARAKKTETTEDVIQPAQLPGRAAILTLKDGTSNATLYGRVTIDGNPDGLQMMQRGHRVKAMTADSVILERACENVDAEKQAYLANGWTE